MHISENYDATLLALISRDIFDPITYIDVFNLMPHHCNLSS